MSDAKFFEGQDFDDLAGLPAIAAENYKFELNWLINHLPRNASTLQVGSHNGKRALSLLEKRPDLVEAGFTGLDFEPENEEKATALLHSANLNATFITGDITAPPKGLTGFGGAVCLNHTLGYIPNQEAALRNMHRAVVAGGIVVVSVFGERFDEKLAHDYFRATTGSEITEVKDTHFTVGNFVVQRYTHADVAAWGGIVTETPLGYLSKYA